MDTPLTEVTKVFKKNIGTAGSLASLKGLWPKDLPEQELRSCLALELSYLTACFFSLESFEIKRSRFSQNKSVYSLLTPVALAIRIAFASNTYGHASLFTERNADYLKATFDKKIPGLGGLVNRPSEPPLESSFIFARSIGMIDALVQKSGLRYSKKGDDFLKKAAALYGEIQGSTAAVTHFLSSQNIPGGWSKILEGPPRKAHSKKK